MITCTRRLEFDSAHRLINHEGKCKMLHGHRYIVEASFVVQNLNGKTLDEVGRVADFGSIRKILGTWIDNNLDHNTILAIADKRLGDQIEEITGQKIYYMSNNPTAENLASHLLNEICPKLFADQPFKCQAIKIYETPNCSAEMKLANF